MTYTIRPAGIRERSAPPHRRRLRHRTAGADLCCARAILRAHDRHIGCRQWIAAAAYLSAGLDDE